MATVTLPYTLTAGTPENVNNLVSNLNALVTGVNTIDTAQIAASAVTTAEVANAAVTSAKLAAGATSATFVTTLPALPVDGQEVFYRADNTNGVIWHLRARSVASGGSATFPWEFVGGGALATDSLAQVASAAAYSTANAWVSIGAAVTITAPLAGEYRTEASASVYNRSATTGAIGVANPTTPASQTNYTSSADQWGVHSISQTLTVTAAAVLTLKFLWGATSDINFYRRGASITITPIRVG